MHLAKLLLNTCFGNNQQVEKGEQADKSGAGTPDREKSLLNSYEQADG